MSHLAPGLRVGPYEIQSLLGAGGMGEVYRAHDTRLGRAVAIKILPPGLAVDPERLRRFEQEARAIAALNDPGICALYDVGEHDGMRFLVLELVDGESLARRLERGPLPVDLALQCGIQIADALKRAHRHGIVHRDLKPANVMLVKNGVKLLDFGLAKLRPEPAGAESMTRPADQTVEGSLLGTLPYMAPEQLEGRSTDARTDLWALGCVLYEMIAGRRPFDGATSATLIAAIMEREPPAPSAVAPLAPSALDRVVKRCLAKDPDDRWQSAKDLAEELKWILEAGPQARVGSVTERPSRGWYAASATGILLLITVAVTVGLPRGNTALRPSLRLSVPLPSDAPLASPAITREMDKPALDISRDGTLLVYVAQVRDLAILYLVDIRTGAARAVPETEGATTPFFSPNGQWIAFFADGKLKKISVAGGPPTVLAPDATSPWGGVWGPDDVIYVNRNEVGGIVRVAAAGGPTEQVAASGVMPALIGSTGRMLVSFSYGGTHWIQDGKAQGRILTTGFGARYVPTGYLVYAEPGRLMAIPFDSSRMTTSGSPVLIADDLRTGEFGTTQFSVSDDGTLVYAAGTDELSVSLVWVDGKGNTQSVGLPERRYGYFSLSPDGGQLAIAEQAPDGGDDLWIYDLHRVGNSSRIVRSETSEHHPRINFVKWFPDGKHLVFWRADVAHNELVVVAADTGSEPLAVWTSTGGDWMYPMSFSPDGKLMLAFNRRLEWHVFPVKDGTIPVHAEPQRIFERRRGGFPQFSPDGRAIAYANEGVKVVAYPETGPPCSVSSGKDPSWISQGRELMFLRGPEAWAVDVLSVPDCRFGEPRFLFRGEYPDRPGFGHDVRDDGREFLMAKKTGWFQTTSSVKLITNVFDELRRRVALAR